MNIEDKIQKDISLKPFTTWQVGGPAKYYLEIKSREDLKAAYIWAKEKKLNVYILGGGSNILVPDQGVDGLVIRMLNTKMAVKGERLECGAGVWLSSAISKAVGNNLSGLEWASGIPRATIGGAIRGNAEAFSKPISGIIETVNIFNIKNMNFQLFSNRDCEFEYRNSIFKKDLNLLIWMAVLKMRKEKSEIIKKNLEKSINFRTEKYPCLPSAGSVFKNFDPNYVKEQNPRLYDRELKNKIGRNNKIAAGLIIDMCGLKGKSMGRVKVSLEHANIIINTGKARTEEIVMLISYIKQQVRDKFGLELQEEIQYFGFTYSPYALIT